MGQAERKENVQELTDYDYTDSFGYTITNPENRVGITDIGEAFIQPGPEWVQALFGLRNRIVSVFKLKTPPTIAGKEEDGPTRWETGSRAGIFLVYGKTENELILGENDRHLDFRVFILMEQDKEDVKKKKVTVTTKVRLNNRLGKVYFFFIKPFHRIIVPAMLKHNLRELETKTNV